MTLTLIGLGPWVITWVRDVKFLVYMAVLMFLWVARNLHTHCKTSVEHLVDSSELMQPIYRQCLILKPHYISKSAGIFPWLVQVKDPFVWLLLNHQSAIGDLYVHTGFAYITIYHWHCKTDEICWSFLTHKYRPSVLCMYKWQGLWGIRGIVKNMYNISIPPPLPHQTNTFLLKSVPPAH